MSNRHLARTIAMQSLFTWDFNGQDDSSLEKVIKSNFDNFAPDFNDNGFVENLVSNVIDNRVDIDKYIVKYATEWPLNQITIVDRNILRIGVYELAISEDIPSKVAINEAIEIAKAFGGASSGKFVNGVLGAIYNDLKDKIEKKKKDLKEEIESAPKQYSAGGIVWHKFEDGLKIALILDAYNRWTFPKGHIEDDEDVKDAVKREVGEELGLKKLKVGEKMGEFEVIVKDPRSTRGPKNISLYLTEARDTELESPQDHESKDAKWVNFDEIESTLGYDQVLEIWNKTKVLLQDNK